MVFGISYGELFLSVGATAARRTKGSSINCKNGRGVAGSINRVHKELQDTMAQLDAIRHEIRSISIINPGPLIRRLMDNPPSSTSDVGDGLPQKREEEQLLKKPVTKDCSVNVSGPINLQSQATTYAKLAEYAAFKSGSLDCNEDTEKLNKEADPFIILPISAESAGILPNRKDLLYLFSPEN